MIAQPRTKGQGANHDAAGTAKAGGEDTVDGHHEPHWDVECHHAGPSAPSLRSFSAFHVEHAVEDSDCGDPLDCDDETDR